MRAWIAVALTCAACHPGASSPPDAPPPPRRPPPDLSRWELVPPPVDAAFDAFGFSVALEGDLLAVGAPGQILSHAPGAVYLYRHGADGWKQAAKLTAKKADPGRRLGLSVALSGHTLAASGKSYVLVFEETEGGWQEKARLASPGSDTFGGAVGLDGDTLAVADEDNDSGPELWAGAVFTYRRGADGSWTQEARLTASPPKNGEIFGSSLALAGTALAVGARQADGPAEASGAVHLFERGVSGWTEVLAGKPTVTERMATLGHAVALGKDGDTELAIAGAPGLRSALAYQRASGGTWKPAGSLDAPEPGSELFAPTLALRGDVAALTVRPKPSDTSIPLVPGTNTLDEKALAARKGVGAARVLIYQRGPDGWRVVLALTHPEAQSGDDFGRALAFGSRGLAVGAPGIGSAVVFGN